LVTATHDEERGLLSEHRGESLEFTISEKDLTNLTGKFVKTVDDGVTTRSHRESIFRELNCHHDEGDVLRGVSLGRSDSDFRSGVDVNTAVRFARDRRTDDVDDSDVEGTTLEAVSHSEDRVGSFSGLRYENADVVSEDGSLAVEEVGSEFDRNGDLGEFFED
jgi:hypothetical protein